MWFDQQNVLTLLFQCENSLLLSFSGCFCPYPLLLLDSSPQSHACVGCSPYPMLPWVAPHIPMLACGLHRISHACMGYFLSCCAIMSTAQKFIQKNRRVAPHIPSLCGLLPIFHVYIPYLFGLLPIVCPCSDLGWKFKLDRVSLNDH